MFDEGFTKYKSYCAEVGSPFPKTDPYTIEYKDEYIDIDNMLFMMNDSIKFNGGNGTNDTETYIGPILHDDIIKHKIRQSYESDYLVDREHISSLIVTDIANVPILVKQYAYELHNLTPEQLKNISNPDTLDNNQRDLIALHSNMNHLTFPEMINLLEKIRINKRFAKLKDIFPVCMSYVFGMYHRCPWKSKGTPGRIYKDSET